MPELAECQAAVNQLNVALIGQTVVRVNLEPWYARARGEHLHQLVGWTVSGVSRRGKAILFEFDNPGVGRNYLLSRLGMTGHWLVRLPNRFCSPRHESAMDPHSAVALRFAGGGSLHYIDKRRFGTLEVAGSEREFEVLRTMGPDPLGGQFSPEWLLACAHRHGVPLKGVLTRPEYAPGVGNWVACEALFRAAVPPSLPGRALTAPQAERLVSALILTLRNGIAKGGATLRDWRLPDGSPGRAQEDFAVYGREGKPCLVCGSPVKKTKVLGRATYQCDQCQSGAEPTPVPQEFVQQVLKATEGMD